jgi:hypothetical protein
MDCRACHSTGSYALEPSVLPRLVSGEIGSGRSGIVAGFSPGVFGSLLLMIIP